MKWHVYKFPSSIPEDASDFSDETVINETVTNESSKLHKYICVSLTSFIVLFCILYMLQLFTDDLNDVDK